MKKIRKDKRGIDGLVILLIVCVVIFASCMGWLISNGMSEEKWMSEEHTCPNCGWTGYAGNMTVKSGGSLDLVVYACPVCGYVLYTT
jgi:predicted RNA-binding Zn-ribbon protein involved in translation (DUF1610 family)